jgi:hypothetical protein
LQGKSLAKFRETTKTFAKLRKKVEFLKRGDGIERKDPQGHSHEMDLAFDDMSG